MTFEPKPTAPTRIADRYEVIERLGSGGMAVVYRVRDISLDRELALKQLREASREVSALFEREFHILAQLSHSSVIHVYDYGFDAAGRYYTMELLDGGDLGESAPLPYGEACSLMAQVCSSLSLLHSRQFVHRDVSPRNVRRSRDGRAKLIDFGAMVPFGLSTQTVGTPAFMAPEVLHRLRLDARCDLYSVGATLYFSITGRVPFSARSLAELPAAWQRELTPASRLVTNVPPALDALIESLLRIDPANRPRSAFEVMQRLHAIAGVESSERAATSLAVMSAPTLVGREAALQRFQARMQSALAGRGGGYAVEGPAGSGRSRVLESCELEAKLRGAVVARIAGSAAAADPFSSVYSLARQLVELLPSVAIERARTSGAYDTLFSATSEPDPVHGERPPALLPLEVLRTDRHALQAALTGWISALGRIHGVVLSVDDAEQVDEASLALLAALADHADDLRLVVLISVETPVVRGAVPALDVLRDRCEASVLAPLTLDESRILFSSVFGAVPHVQLLSDRIHDVAAGLPREAMALAQHLLDRQLLWYADGSWVLPGDLTVTDLPADAEHALRQRVEMLPQLARRLAEAQALALPGAWSRADYAAIAGIDELGQIDDALVALLRRGVLVSDGPTYSLAHQGLRACLASQLSAAQKAEHHLALAALCSQRDRFGLSEVHHLLLAGAESHALDRIAHLLRDVSDRTDFSEASGMHGRDIAATFERAFEAAVASNRPAREIHELARHLNALAVVVDHRLHYRYAKAWVAQLESDSGLNEFRSLDPEIEAGERLRQAIQHSLERYQATPERDRVYRVDEAIRYLARHVTMSIAIGARARDTRLLSSIPGLLEPFAALSPILHALWQNAISSAEMNYLGQIERARTRAFAVYNDLEKCQGDELRYVDLIRNAIAFAMASLEVTIGHPSAWEWIEILDRDPLQRVNAMHLRRLLCIMEGDGEGAVRFGNEAELLAVQAAARQMFVAPLRQEVLVQFHARDLAGLKHAADQLAAFAAEDASWQSNSDVAHGFYQRVRGDLTAAKLAFERCLAATDPDQTDPPPDVGTWVSSAAGYVGVLVDMGRYAEAREYGIRALERCAKHEVDALAFDLIREVSLAEAKLGAFVAAAERMDAVIEQRRGMMESSRIVDYETRARIAIDAGDDGTVERYAELMVGTNDPRGLAFLRGRGRILSEARRAGIALEVTPSQFESSIIGNGPRRESKVIASHLTSLFRHESDPAARAKLALQMLCDAMRCVAGHLYLAQGAGLVRVATLGSPDAGLDGFVSACWMGHLEDIGVTTALTVGDSAPDDLPKDVWIDAGGLSWRVIPLRSQSANASLFIGVAAIQMSAAEPVPTTAWHLARGLADSLVELGDVVGVSPA